MFIHLLVTELAKLRRAKITWITWLAVSVLPLVGGLFMWIVQQPGRAAQLGLLGKKAQFVALTADSASYFALLLQSTGMVGMIVVSVITAYVFGREYADGTAKNMLTLPIARHWLPIAKLLVVLGWFAALTASQVVEGLVLCRAMALPGYSTALALQSMGDIFLAAAVAWLQVPVVAWIAIRGRGYLAPLGFTISMLVLGNVLGATGWGKWFPWSIVPLFAGVAGPRVDTLASGSLFVLGITFLAGTFAAIAQLRFGDNTQ